MPICFPRMGIYVISIDCCIFQPVYNTFKLFVSHFQLFCLFRKLKQYLLRDILTLNVSCYCKQQRFKDICHILIHTTQEFKYTFKLSKVVFYKNHIKVLISKIRGIKVIILLFILQRIMHPAPGHIAWACTSN